MDDVFAEIFGLHAASLSPLAAAAALCACLPAAATLALLLRRARRCADHAATWLAVHVAVTSGARAALPPHAARWWALHAASATFIAISAEALCRRLEEHERAAFKRDIDAEASVPDLEDPPLRSDDLQLDSVRVFSLSASAPVASSHASCGTKSRSEEEVSLLELRQ